MVTSNMAVLAAGVLPSSESNIGVPINVPFDSIGTKKRLKQRERIPFTYRGARPLLREAMGMYPSVPLMIPIRGIIPTGNRVRLPPPPQTPFHDRGINTPQRRSPIGWGDGNTFPLPFMRVPLPNPIRRLIHTSVNQHVILISVSLRKTEPSRREDLATVSGCG